MLKLFYFITHIRVAISCLAPINITILILISSFIIAVVVVHMKATFNMVVK